MMLPQTSGHTLRLSPSISLPWNRWWPSSEGAVTLTLGTGRESVLAKSTQLVRTCYSSSNLIFQCLGGDWSGGPLGTTQTNCNLPWLQRLHRPEPSLRFRPLIHEGYGSPQGIFPGIMRTFAPQKTRMGMSPAKAPAATQEVGGRLLSPQTSHRLGFLVL